MNRITQVSRNVFSYETFHRFFSSPYLGLALIPVLFISFFQPLHLQYWEEGTVWPFFWAFVFKVLSLCLVIGGYFLAVPKGQKCFRVEYQVSFFVLQAFHVFCLSLAWGIIFSWLSGLSSALFLTWLFATNFNKGGIANYVEGFLWWVGAREAADHISNTWKEEIQDMVARAGTYTVEPGMDLFGSFVYTWIGMTILFGGYFFLVLQALSRM